MICIFVMTVYRVKLMSGLTSAWFFYFIIAAGQSTELMHGVKEKTGSNMKMFYFCFIYFQFFERVENSMLMKFFQ